MVLIWLPKRYLAKALDSSTMRGEATCSLSCIQITFVLFVGSLLIRVWRGGWWVDGATSIVLSILFAWEGFKMVRWASSAEFNGGCCESCRIDIPTIATGDEELGEVYRDICKCCSEKEACRDSDECKCSPDSASHEINVFEEVDIHTKYMLSNFEVVLHRMLVVPQQSQQGRSVAPGKLFASLVPWY